MRRTKWIDGTAQPARPGVYECAWLDGGWQETWFNLWDGTKWHWGCDTAAEAAITDQGKIPKRIKLLRWRGVCSPNG